MTALDFLLYLSIGRLVTWMLQIASPVKALMRLPGCVLQLALLHNEAEKTDSFMDEFIGCDLCLGFWVYLALALLWQPEQSLNLWPCWVEIAILSMLSTLLAHLLRLGWQSKFGITVVN